MPSRKRYKVRPAWKGSSGDERGKEITLPPDWCDYHQVQVGDMVTVLSNSIVVLLPPNVSKAVEAKARQFLEEGIGEA